eukprot:TRINITY_DN6578_c0_g1_i1.p1 TRINITY_DN6578_c0_g1~~TRINITY_DN6578_c0_g1_i1.p1  ORF type:complete len:653 (+),score=104.47 TRINITY_DN6578_c0_g1_i1:137-2095(+)
MRLWRWGDGDISTRGAPRGGASNSKINGVALRTCGSLTRTKSAWEFGAKRLGTACGAASRLLLLKCSLVAGGWVFDGGMGPVPEEAILPGSGYRLINVGPDRGILVDPSGKSGTVRWIDGSFGGDAVFAPEPGLSPTLQSALKAAADARSSLRAPCPVDADAVACDTWCKAVAPAGLMYVGSAQGTSCATFTKSAKDGARVYGPTCACGPAEEPRAFPSSTCRSPCSKQTLVAKKKASKLPEIQSKHKSPTPPEEMLKPTSLKKGVAKQAVRAHTRYLLYDAKFGVTFAEQLELFLAALGVVRSLNAALPSSCQRREGDADCAEWTLVLPPWCSVVHWYTDNEAMPWQELFDIPTSSTHATLPRMVEFEDVQGALAALDIVAVLPAAVPTPGRSGQLFRWAKSVQDCEQLTSQRQVVPQRGRKNSAVVYSGYCDGDLKVSGGVRCGLLSEPTQGATVQLLKSLGAGTRVVVLKHLEAVGLHSNLGSSAERDQAAALRPAAILEKIARRFVKKTLGPLPFLAVHIRRNDFVASHPDWTPSAAAAAARINHILRQSKLEQVFVATDARADFREELRRLVKAPLYYFASDDGAPEINHRGREDVILMQVLVKGRHFIGTAKCHFSSAVLREREKSTSEVFCRNLSDKSANHRCSP